MKRHKENCVHYIMDQLFLSHFLSFVISLFNSKNLNLSNFKGLQRRIWNPVKHLKWSFFAKIDLFRIIKALSIFISFFMFFFTYFCHILTRMNRYELVLHHPLIYTRPVRQLSYKRYPREGHQQFLRALLKMS